MASDKLLSEYKLVIQALSEKYQVSPYRIETVLSKLPNKELAVLDWKDLDAVVQEGLLEK